MGIEHLKKFQFSKKKAEPPKETKNVAIKVDDNKPLGGVNERGHEGGLVHGEMHNCANFGLKHESGTSNSGTKGLY